MQAQHQQNCTDNDAPDQPRPVTIGSELRPPRKHIAAGQSNPPKRENGQPKCDRDILVPAQRPLERCIYAVTELHGECIEQEDPQELPHLRVRRIERRDRVAHHCEQECDHTDEEERKYAAEADIGTRPVLPAGADLVAYEDRDRHGDGERQHVDDRGEVHRRLMCSEHGCPVRRHEKADGAENTLLAEHREADGDADREQCPPFSRDRFRQTREDMVARKLFHTQNDNAVQHKKNAVAQRRAKPCTRAAQGWYAARAVHKDIVQDDVDRNGRHRDIHGEARPSVCVDEVAQNDRGRNRNQSEGNVGKILHRNVLDHGFERECTHEHRHGQDTNDEQEHSKERRPVETLLNDAPNFPHAPRSVVLRDHGSQPRDKPHKSPEYGEEDARADSNPCKILLADMPCHNRIEEARRHKGNLRHKDGKEHNKELTGTRRISMDFPQNLPPLLSWRLSASSSPCQRQQIRYKAPLCGFFLGGANSVPIPASFIISPKIIGNSVGNSLRNLFDPRFAVHHALFIRI